MNETGVKMVLPQCFFCCLSSWNITEAIALYKLASNTV